MSIVTYNKTFDTLNGLLILLSQIQKYIAALDSFDEMKNDGIAINANIFIATALDALEQQCISETVKIIDNAHFNKIYDNCSLELLKEYCLDKDMESFFSEGENDSLIIELDSCINALNSTVSRYIRNKQVAHHDFDQMISGEEQIVSFSSVITGISETVNVVCRISDRVTKAEYSGIVHDYDILKASYKTAIKELI